MPRDSRVTLRLCEVLAMQRENWAPYWRLSDVAMSSALCCGLSSVGRGSALVYFVLMTIL